MRLPQNLIPLRLHTDARGASATEYALLVALIAAVAVLAVSAFGGQVADLFERLDLTKS